MLEGKEEGKFGSSLEGRIGTANFIKMCHFVLDVALEIDRYR